MYDFGILTERRQVVVARLGGACIALLSISTAMNTHEVVVRSELLVALCWLLSSVFRKWVSLDEVLLDRRHPLLSDLRKLWVKAEDNVLKSEDA